MRHHTMIGFMALILLGLAAAGSFAVIARDSDSGGEVSGHSSGLPYEIEGYKFTHTIGGPLIPTSPVDVAIAPDGRIFVADIGLNRVLAFTPDGALDTSWGASGMSERLVFPSGVAIGPAGSLFVLQISNAEVHVLDDDGKALAEWRIGGDQNTTSTVVPTSIAVGDDGVIYIPDQRAKEIRRFERDGTALVSWALPQVGDGIGNIWPRDVAVIGGDVLLTYQHGTGPGGGILRFNSNGEASEAAGLVVVPPDELGARSPGSIAGTTDGQVVLLYLHDEDDVPPLIATATSFWEPEGIPSLSMINGLVVPGIAVDSNGRILVADPSRQQIRIYGQDGDVVGEIRSPEDAGLFAGLDEVAIGPGDTLYAADPLRGRVIALSPDGIEQGIYQLSGTGTTETNTGFTRLRMRAAVDDEGAVYALDETTAQIAKFDAGGDLLSADWLGNAESAEPVVPLLFSAGSGDRIYLVDVHEQDRLRVYSTDGVDQGLLAEPASQSVIQDVAASGDVVYTIELGIGTSPLRAFSSGGELLDVEADLSRGRGNENRTGFAIAPDQRGGMLVAAVNVRSGPEFEYLLLRVDAGGEIEQLGTLDIPYTTLPDIAVDSAGRLYIAAPNDQRIYVYDPVS